MKKATQYHKLSLVESRLKVSGQPAVAVFIPDAQAYVLYDDPEQLLQLAKHIQEWAGALVQKQRKGNATIWTPPGFPTRAASISPN